MGKSKASPSATKSVQARPSRVAQNVALAFKAAAIDAVNINTRRGHLVVGMVDGVWTEKNSKG